MKISLTNENELEKYHLSRVIDLYLKYILSYIFDYVNTRNLKEKEYHLHNLYMLLIEHILEIINYYSNLLTIELERV